VAHLCFFADSRDCADVDAWNACDDGVSQQGASARTNQVASSRAADACKLWGHVDVVCVCCFSPVLFPFTYRLGGNAAFPSRGQRENYAVVLKAARGEGSLSIQGYRLPQDGVFSASHFSPTSSSHDSVAEVAAAGAVDGTLAGTTAAERRYDAQIEVEGKGVAGDVLGDIVQQCEGQDAAKSCLENMHACMAPYKMGDISSCHCFTTSWASGAVSAEKNAHVRFSLACLLLALCVNSR
jgi:hypothetical protein